MKTNHTPVPWIVERFGNNPHFEIRADGETICHLRDHRPENAADAALMAAAPDLLLALKIMLNTFGKKHSGGTAEVHSVSIAKDAIAKAEGGQP